MGYQTFITGMAYGVDIWAGQIVVELRKNNPDLHLIAAIPFPGFESRWSNEWRQAYEVTIQRGSGGRASKAIDYGPDIS